MHRESKTIFIKDHLILISIWKNLRGATPDYEQSVTGFPQQNLYLVLYVYDEPPYISYLSAIQTIRDKWTGEITGKINFSILNVSWESAVKGMCSGTQVAAVKQLWNVNNVHRQTFTCTHSYCMPCQRKQTSQSSRDCVSLARLWKLEFKTQSRRLQRNFLLKTIMLFLARSGVCSIKGKITTWRITFSALHLLFLD